MAVRRLGKGLEALIPDIPPEDEIKAGRLRDVEVAAVSPNPFQPRESFDQTALAELKQSIAENGVIQPISVRQVDSGYELIAGERRLRAVSELGLPRIPAFVLDVQTDEEMIELSLIENIQREDLNPIDEARGYQTLITKCNLTQEEVAKKVGKDRSTITNFLRMLKLPGMIQESLVKGEITAGHARSLLSLDSKGEQVEVWKKILQDKITVRQVEKIVKTQKPARKTKKESRPPENPFLRETEDKFRSILGTQVRIHANKRGAGGRIEIEYYSDTDIERIMELLERI